jgi:DNA replication terminus site-binding protein
MENLQYYMTEMEQDLTEIKSMLMRFAAPQKCHYFELPRITVEQEKEIIESGYDQVPVKHVKGKLALSMAVEALSDWYVYDDNLSRRFLHKHPGIIVVDDYTVFLEIQHRIAILNSAKQRFKELVQRYGNDWTKWKAVHDKFSYVITMSVYRDIQCYDNAYDAVYFNWVTRRRSKKYTREDLILRLDNAVAHPSAKYTQEQWNIKMADEKRLIESSSYHSFSERRTINYRPELNLRKDKKMINVSAGLPIVLPAEPIKMTNLEDFDIHSRTTRAKSDNWHLMLPRIHVYARS